MPFNTAIFYDIENLLKGYNFSSQVASNLCLADIVREVRKTNRIGEIAVQRAYANWSDPRLAMMRGEINELGIDPIQVFGFSREPKKNAADIQLAIDAIDLAHVREALDVFVIVSGDGGFASLAKKLHEYGKTVIGCAYRTATNKNFQAVCDAFVSIADPEEEERHERAVAPPASHPAAADPRNVRLAKRVSKCMSTVPEQVIAKVKDVLRWYESDPECRAELGHGVHLSSIQQSLKIAIPDLQVFRFGFSKFIEFLQYACKGTNLCVARPANLHTQAVLVLRLAVPAGFEVLPDVEPQDLQTVEGYRTLLGIGGPVFRLPTATEIQMIAAWLDQHPPDKLDFGVVVESISAALNGAIGAKAVRDGVLSFVAAEAFERSESTSLAELKLTLQNDTRGSGALLTKLQRACGKKLNTMIPGVREDLLNQLLGTAH